MPRITKVCFSILSQIEPHLKVAIEYGREVKYQPISIYTNMLQINSCEGVRY